MALRIALSLLTGFVIALVASPVAEGRIWTDPDWPTMLAKSDRIVLAEVVTGGKFVAKVKTVKTFKGNAPAEPFWIDDFNDPQTNEKSIALGAFKKGEQYYLFLRTTRIPPWIDELSKDPALAEYVKALKAGQVCSVWTPSAGAFLRADDKVRFTLHWTSYSRFRGTERSAEEFETIIEKAGAYATAQKRDRAFLDSVAKKLADEQMNNEKVDLGHRLLTLHLAGENRYLDRFKDLASHEAPGTRVPLARLMGQIEDERAQAVLRILIKDKHAIVQGEAVRQFAKGDPKIVGPALLAELPTAGRAGLGPKELLDPVRNEMPGGLIEMVQALGTIKYRPAAKALLPLLERPDPQLIAVTIGALREMDNHDYVAYLEKHLKAGDRNTSRIITQIAKELKLTGLKTGFESYITNPKNTNPYERMAAIETLAELGDEGSAKILLQELHKHLNKTNADDDDGRLMTDLVAALKTMKHGPAKRAIYDTVFFWFAYDDSFATEPRLFDIKKKLEQETVERALKSVADLKGVKAHCMVFLDNRKELAATPTAQPKVRVLVHVETTNRFGFDGSDRAVRARIAKAVETSVDNVGLSHSITDMGRTVSGVDARMDSHPVQFLMWQVLGFLSPAPDANDEQFLRWAVANRRIEYGLASEYLPKMFPPKKRTPR